MGAGGDNSAADRRRRRSRWRWTVKYRARLRGKKAKLSRRCVGLLCMEVCAFSSVAPHSSDADSTRAHVPPTVNRHAEPQAAKDAELIAANVWHVAPLATGAGIT